MKWPKRVVVSFVVAGTLVGLAALLKEFMTGFGVMGPFVLASLLVGVARILWLLRLFFAGPCDH